MVVRKFDAEYQHKVVGEDNTGSPLILDWEELPEFVCVLRSVAIFLGNGDGTFRSPQYFSPVGIFPRAIALADFNGDGQLDVTANDGHERQLILLNTGVAALSPAAPLVFGNQQHGTTSSAKSVTLTNTGTKALKIHSMKAVGQFAVTSTCGPSVAAGANCAISVTFSPKTAGGKTGTIQINDSASSKPQVISLSGTGT